MPLQNRVTPTGEIIADPARGTLMGNRGILHDADRRLGSARWRHPHWICCRLRFKGRRREVMAPRRYTELFFLDEATAPSAPPAPTGARTAPPDPGRAALADLPRWRLRAARRRARRCPFDRGRRVLPWRPAGYGAPRPRPSAARCLVLTPQPTVAALRAGYAPALHPSAA